MGGAVKRVAVFVVLSALAGGFGVPAALAQDGQGDEKLVLRIGTTNELDSLNPFKAVETPSYEMFTLQYNLLVEFAQEDLTPVPGIAESWEVSEDNLTWTYSLNPDARWHDGRPVTAEDVKFTYELILDNPAPGGLFIDYLGQIEEIDVPDDHTVVITTKQPSVQMLSMYVPILPKHVWEKVPTDEIKSFRNEPSVGSGPFRAVEWRRGQFVRLVKNPEYFRGEPTIDEVVMQFYDNPDTMVQALRQGEIDYALNPPTRLFEQLSGEPDIQTRSALQVGFTELAFNLYEPTPEVIEEFGAPKTTTGHPALLDKRVRQAINWAIDEQALTDKVLLGQGIVGSTIVSPLYAKYHLDLPDDELMGFDIERAKELLAQAGWEDTDGNGVVDRDGEDLELRLFTRSESTPTVKAGQFVEGWLGQAGIDVATEAVTDNKLTTDIYAADFDMFIWGWGGDPDPDFILSVLTCDQFMSWSDSFWCNEEYSRLYQKQKTQFDVDERAETIKEMQRLAYEESPYVVFYYDNTLEAYRTDRLEGWVSQPADNGTYLFNYGRYSYMNLRPAGRSATSAANGGASAGVVAIGVVALVVVLGAVVVFVRRGSTEERA